MMNDEIDNETHVYVHEKQKGDRSIVAVSGPAHTRQNHRAVKEH